MVGFRQRAGQERAPQGGAVEEVLPQRSRGEAWNRGSSGESGRGPEARDEYRPKARSADPVTDEPQDEQTRPAPSPRSSEAFWSQIESSRQAAPPEAAPRYNDVPRRDETRRDEPRYGEQGRDDRRYAKQGRDEQGRDEPRYDDPRREEQRYGEQGREEQRYDEPRRDESRHDGLGRKEERYNEVGRDQSRYDEQQPDASQPDPRYDQRPVPQSKEQREQQERARDASDALWLRDLARPATPQSLFKPQQPNRDPRPQQLPQGYYGPRDPNSQARPNQAYQQSMPGRDDRPPNPEPTGQPGQSGQPNQSGQSGKKQRLAWIDTARGLAIILVVFIHATQWVQEAPIRIGLWDDINEVVSTLRMPLFFMCAGILATKWLYASWADLIAKKVFFLGWVFAIWQVVGSLEAVVAAQITGDQLTPVRMVVSLALSPVRPRFELWFIWALAIFFVITRLTSRFPLAPQLAVGALMASVAFSDLIPEVNLGWNGFLKYYLFFVIGSYYRPLLLTLANRLTKPLALAATGGWLAIATLTYVTGLIYLPGVGLVVRLFGLVAGIGVALLLQNIKLFSYLGSRTLPIFLAHTPLLVLMVFVLDQVATSAGVQAIKWFLPILLTVPAIYLALVLNRAVLKTPARVVYEPPAQATDLVRNTIAQQPGGAEKMHPSEVPGLHERPFERQLERVLA